MPYVCCLSFIEIQNSYLFENLSMVSFFGLLGGYNCRINFIKLREATLDPYHWAHVDVKEISIISCSKDKLLK